MAIELFSLFIISIIVRLPFLFRQGEDREVHMWQIQKAVLNGFGGHKAIFSIVKGIQGYPNFPHYLISLFPAKHQYIIGHVLNILYDVLMVVMFYIVIKYLNVTKGEIAFASLEFWASVLLSFSPILLASSARLNSIGGRPLGNLLLLLYMIFQYMMIEVNWMYVAPLFILGILIILSSQFALQGMVLFNLFFSIITLNPTPFLLSVAIITFGVLFNIFGIKNFFKYKLNHYKWYFKFAQKGTTAQGMNSIKDFFLIPMYIFRDQKKLVNIFFKQNTFIIAFYSIPFLAFFIIFYKEISLFSNISPVINYVFIICLSAGTAFFLTSLKPLLFIGEGHRYLEYAAPFLYFLFFAFVSEHFPSNVTDIVLLLLLVQIVLSTINFLVLNQSDLKDSILNSISDLDFEGLCKFLTEEKEEEKILVIPSKSAHSIAAKVKKHLYRYPFVSDKSDGFLDQQNEDIIVYFPKSDIDSLITKYGFSLVVVNNQLYNKVIKNKLGIEYSVPGEKVFKNETYSVYRVN